MFTFGASAPTRITTRANAASPTTPRKTPRRFHFRKHKEARAASFQPPQSPTKKQPANPPLPRAPIPNLIWGGSSVRITRQATSTAVVSGRARGAILNALDAGAGFGFDEGATSLAAGEDEAEKETRHTPGAVDVVVDEPAGSLVDERTFHSRKQRPRIRPWLSVTGADELSLGLRSVEEERLNLSVGALPHWDLRRLTRSGAVCGAATRHSTLLSVCSVLDAKESAMLGGPRRRPSSKRVLKTASRGRDCQEGQGPAGVHRSPIARNKRRVATRAWRIASRSLSLVAVAGCSSARARRLSSVLLLVLVAFRARGPAPCSSPRWSESER
ncbi:hypothetical protein BDK51DRAFT_40679 [Blyttiomyces helicus]|uniref:Uncharacterized protein n=1 Tax=Blyttiomyces helicus TaxID=388810 RepID=A0A4P9W670_9FUNG|nr:hypothetical protein BDK51DRAFT_40679 [Blyttiomyces helicus]|eukprot:RKO87472.1 hypothetical protein BDK51DRAFT_40679 [Blyttiomyces helicus]